MTKYWQLIVIALLTIITYSNIFHNQFAIDDQYFIQDWSLTRSWSSVGQLISGANPESQPGVYRPIRSLLYLVYYQLWGTNPLGYHLHSLLVHLVATILVFLIVEKLFPKLKYVPFIASLVFGLHPIHTESITYIAASMEMIGIVFFFSALLSYLHNKYTLTTLLAGIAFFTYEMTLTLPIILLLYEFTIGKKRWPKIVPIFILVGIYLLLRLGILHISAARGDYLAFSFYHTQLTMIKMWLKYLWMLVYPVTLSHNHTILPGFESFMTPYSDGQAILAQSIFDLPVLFALTALTSLVFAAIKLKDKLPWLTFLIGWFFITLLPVAYFLPQGTAFAEKYLYLASFSFITLLAIGLYKLLAWNKNLGIMSIAIIMLFYGSRTYTRNQNWQSPRTLWEDEALIHPRSELAFFNLGIIYTGMDQKDKAINSYQQALRLKPQFWEAENNLTNLLQ